MKILLVSMPSLHFFRWTEQLENSGHDVYWFDIVDGNPTNRLPWVSKINGWRIKYSKLKGRYFIKNRLPYLYALLEPLIERNVANQFEKSLIRIQPDIVHSFAMQISCVPIIDVMQKYPKQKWVYSSWGSDLYNLKSVNLSIPQVKRALGRINYLITDCLRDYDLAKKYNFTGVYLGSIPGGGGYDYTKTNSYIITPNLKRNIILIKGYQGDLGRCNQVLLALSAMRDELLDYQIIVFSADKDVLRFIEKLKLDKKLNISVLKKETFLPHIEILKLMGKSLIYIGNSISDGMPNTLLEAIIMGAYPIQSNPGGATAEVVTNNVNGTLIEDPENIQYIQELISNTILNHKLIKQAFEINQNEIKPKYRVEKIKKQVLEIYLKAHNETNN
ncbi:glycosyltransferase [Algibacter sp. R77976]|uniref:glycosyltransferase n=1 Tax=Algibacter sp. R77976 TaxID=3093873 RepID=UPI0037C87153